MGYGMKYTKGGFPFKSSPAKQSEKDASVKVSELDAKGKAKYKENNQKSNNTYDRVNAQTADNSGPVKPVNQTVATDARKFEQNELVNELDDKAEYVETDIENEKVSSKKGNKIIKELNSKANKLRVPSAKSKKIEPSYPATPEGNKKRSAAEQALEKKEDEAGQN